MDQKVECKYCNRSGLNIRHVNPKIMCDDCLGSYHDECDNERERMRDE